jgi:hypothetical protein
MNVAPKGFGVLRAVLEAARAEERCSREALTVLSVQVDPYRFDTPSGHRDGAWFAEQLRAGVSHFRSVHLRGLHYIVATGEVVKPNGEIYRNTDADWIWFSETAAKASRWLNYTDFQRIVDNRNSEPVTYRKPKAVPRPWLSIGLDITIPDIDDIDPCVGVSDFEGRQSYALAIWGEKASLEHVVLPIALRYEADAFLGTGEISDTRLWEMARDATVDGRPLVVFVLADFDPAGYQMPISIGRKLQAFRDLCFPEFEFELVPVAMTPEQVRELNLPSTPLKETEKRADRWREAFSLEQTEIDSLAALRPAVLRQILEDAIEPYFDRDLERRIDDAKADWEKAAALEEQIDSDTLNAIRERAAARLEELRAAVESINEQLQMAVDGVVELPEAIVPEPEIDAEKRARQAPLISSSWSWAEATRALKARKSYGEGAR